MTTRIGQTAPMRRSWLTRRSDTPPTWQTMGAMVAGSVLALAVTGALFLGALGAPDDGVVAGEQARQILPGSTGTGDPAMDQALQQARRDGRLTQEQVAALSRAIAGQPTFDDVRRLTDDDVERLADATGLTPAELAPVLARLVATGRIAMPAAPAQAIAAPATTRVTTITRDTLPGGGAASRRETISSSVVTMTPVPEVIAGEQALATAVPRWPQNGAPIVDPNVRGPVK